MKSISINGSSYTIVSINKKKKIIKLKDSLGDIYYYIESMKLLVLRVNESILVK